MVTIRTNFPRQFFFECSTCGRYHVSEETLRKFLASELEEKLDQRLKGGAEGAILKFKESCPVCQPDSTYKLELIALHLKVQ